MRDESAVKKGRPKDTPLLSMDDPRGIKRRFLIRMDGLGGLDMLFESVPETIFWVKDDGHRFVMGNQAAVEKAGLMRIEDWLGKTDFDVYPPNIARKFVEDDLWVLKSGKPIVNRAELHIMPSGSLGWHSTTKVPVFDRRKNVIGVAGICRKMDQSAPDFGPLREMSKVMAFISEHLDRPIARSELAKLAGLSETEFGRRFKKLMGVTPGVFILDLRLKLACRRLAESRDSVGNIALGAGFYDASVFSRYFRRHLGITPLQYRTRFSSLS